MKKITAADLYAMGMESPTAWRCMRELCAIHGVEYPPKQEPPQPPRKEIPDPFKEPS